MSNEPQILNQKMPTSISIPKTFPELLALYREKEAESNIDLLQEPNYRVRPGLELRKNGAIQVLPSLRAELYMSVEQNSGSIFLSGSNNGVRAFIGEAQDQTEGTIVVVSAKEMYSKLANIVELGLHRDRRFSMETINIFINGIRILLEELSVDGIQAPNLVPYLNNILPDTESVVAFVREVLQSIKARENVTVGDGLNAIFLQIRAAEEVIKEGISSTFIPVIVIDATEDDKYLVDNLFFGRNVFFKVETDEVNSGVVTNIIKQLKKVRSVRLTKNGSNSR